MHTQRSSIGSFDLATDESSGLIILVEFTGFFKCFGERPSGIELFRFFGPLPEQIPSRDHII